MKQSISDFGVLVYYLHFIVGGDNCNSYTMYTISDVCECLIKEKYNMISYEDSDDLSMISYVSWAYTYILTEFKFLRMVNINTNQFTIH